MTTRNKIISLKAVTATIGGLGYLADARRLPKSPDDQGRVILDRCGVYYVEPIEGV